MISRSNEKNNNKMNTTAPVLLIDFITLNFYIFEIYHSFRPTTILKHMIITNQCAAFNQCLFRGVVNTSGTP